MVAGVNREQRVVALEHRNRAHRPVQIAMIAADVSETEDEAVARHVAMHGPLPEVDDGGITAIVMVPVEPTREAMVS